MTDTNDVSTHALTVIDQRTVRVTDDGTEVLAVRVQSGDIFVPVRPLCAILGVEANGQIQRMRRREALAELLRPIAVPTAGGD